MNDKPLQPLTEGIVLIVGVKPSNLDDAIKNHPRVVMWDSQHEHWVGKDLPANTRAVFMTRFVGHRTYDHVISQVRRRKLTIFNPEGTGSITKQVKELLNLNPPTPVVTDTVTEIPVNVVPQEEPMPKPKNFGERGKLDPLIPFVDYEKKHIENAEFLMQKATELGITTTKGSLAVWVGKLHKKRQSGIITGRVKFNKVIKQKEQKSSEARQDVSVQLLDNSIRELQDIRDFLIATVEENRQLKARIEKFKSFLSGE